jgi:pimeloyl-ACP methyl ester carboxylesterase
MLYSCLFLAALGAAVSDSTARTIVLAPAESLRVTVDGPATGPAVVIIPGIVSPAYAYRRIIPPLVDAGMRTIVVEPLGTGSSSRPGKADYSYTTQAARVAAVLDSLQVSRAIVMGHVAGTSISLRLAVAHPELVRGLLLVEGTALESPAVPGVRNALKFAFIIRLFAGKGRVRKELRKGLVESSGDTTWVTDEVIEGYTEDGAGDIGAVLRALKGMQNSVEPDSLTPQLSRIHVPVRLLLGGAAHQGGPSQGRVLNLQRHLSNFSMRTVFGAGVHIQEEQPEVIVRELLDLNNETEP